MIHHDYTNFAVNSPLPGVDPLLLIVNPLLQRSLAKVLEVVGRRIRFTNLIPHHRITYTLNQTTELGRVLGVVKVSPDLALPLQRDQISKNPLQFPANPRVSDSTLACPWRVCAHSSSLILLSPSLTSPWFTGSQSRSASSPTRGANDSIACLFAFVRCGLVSPTDSL